MIKRYFLSPGGSFFLFGPRGTGKTTWIKYHLSSALYLDLLDPALFRRYKARPERLRDWIAAHPEKVIVIIDEIQKCPELLDVVHALIEENFGLQFILTGSSARKIKQKGVNLLGGRALIRSLHPFMASELGGDFDLEEALRSGLIPLVLASGNEGETLSAYVSLYMKEEIQMEGLVRKMGGFSRFLEAVSFSHGAVLNVSNVARESEVERKTIQGFIEILYDLLMAYSIPVFSKRAKREVVRHSKFYFFDAGVFRTIRPAGPLDRREEIEGAALEGLIAQHLRAWIDYSRDRFGMYYWRTRSGTEVDFVVYGEKGFWAVEVKNTKAVRKGDLRALKSFREDYPECRAVLLYRGNERIIVDGILCLSCDEFLKALKPDSPLIPQQDTWGSVANS